MDEDVGKKRDKEKDGQKEEKGGERREIVLRRGKGMKERSESGSSTKSLEELWGKKEKLGEQKEEKGKRKRGEKIFRRSEVTRRTPERKEGKGGRKKKRRKERRAEGI